MRKTNFLLVLLIFILIYLNFHFWKFLFSIDQKLHIFFFNLSKGEAILIETPWKSQILIDGGSGKEILKKLEKILPFWDKTIDLVILTHPEKDHFGGLIYVLRYYRIKNIITNSIEREIFSFKKWKKALEKEKAKKFFATPKMRIVQGEIIGEILWPIENLPLDFLKKGTNDSSVVLKLSFGKVSFLFTGDLTEKAERELTKIAKGKLFSNVLKVAHHGSRSSSSEVFLKEVLPELAVVCPGKKNPYGFPKKAILKKFENFGINILRTDLLGDIEIITDGQFFRKRFFNL